MDYDTKLIMLVKQFPELYDNGHSDFKNKDVRQSIWADIAYQLRKECDEKSVRIVRSRWKSLRDSYVKETKHKLSLCSGSAKPKKDWRYSQEMSFLTPHLAISHPKAYQNDDVKLEEDNIEDQQSMETYFVDVDSFQETPEGGHFMGALLDYSAEKFAATPPVTILAGESDIDSFFKGVAEVVKRLNPINQVKIQKDIVNMVLDVKMKEVQENNNDQ